MSPPLLLIIINFIKEDWNSSAEFPPSDDAALPENTIIQIAVTPDGRAPFAVTSGTQSCDNVIGGQSVDGIPGSNHVFGYWSDGALIRTSNIYQ